MKNLIESLAAAQSGKEVKKVLDGAEYSTLSEAFGAALLEKAARLGLYRAVSQTLASKKSGTPEYAAGVAEMLDLWREGYLLPAEKSKATRASKKSGTSGHKLPFSKEEILKAAKGLKKELREKLEGMDAETFAGIYPALVEKVAPIAKAVETLKTEAAKAEEEKLKAALEELGL